MHHICMYNNRGNRLHIVTKRGYATGVIEAHTCHSVAMPYEPHPGLLRNNEQVYRKILFGKGRSACLFLCRLRPRGRACGSTVGLKWGCCQRTDLFMLHDPTTPLRQDLTTAGTTP